MSDDLQESINRMNKLGGIYSDLAAGMSQPAPESSTQVATPPVQAAAPASSAPSAPAAGGVGQALNTLNALPDIAATGLGAMAGSKVAKAFPDYVAPEAAPNPAQLARDEWLKNQSAHQAGIQDYELKLDALKRQSDDLAQLHLMEKNDLEKARNAYIEEKIKAKTPSGEAPQKIVLPDEHTRQIQGTGSAAPDTVTGRASQTGYQARTQEIAEHGAAGKTGLKALQTEGLVKPGGITLEFPGITASSPMGVLAPAPMQTEFDAAYKKIIESSIPQEQKLAMLKDLYQEQKTAAGSAASAKKSAENKLLEHINSREAQITPLERAALEAQQKFENLGGHAAAAADLAAESPLARVISKVKPLLGPLGGALAARDIYKGYEAGKAGNQTQALSKYASGLGGALMMIPTAPTVVTGAAITAAGAGKDLYDYYMSLPPAKQKELNEQLAISSGAY